MSRFSANHHLRAPQRAVLSELVARLWTDPDTLDVQELSVDEAAASQEDDCPDDELCCGWIVSPNEEDGLSSEWTRLWSDCPMLDHGCIPSVVEALGCDALYGHHNDSVDNWRWIRFSRGAPVAEYWYLGQAWYRCDSVPPPPGALTLGEAYAVLGRSYAHESFRSALNLASRLPPNARARWRVLRFTSQVHRRPPSARSPG